MVTPRVSSQKKKKKRDIKNDSWNQCTILWYKRWVDYSELLEGLVSTNLMPQIIYHTKLSGKSFSETEKKKHVHFQNK